MKIHPRIVLLLKILLSGLSIFIVYKNINVADTWKVLKSVNLFYLLPPYLLYLLSKYATAERFRLLLVPAGIVISRIENLKLYLLGMYYNIFLPGGLSGDAYKAFYLNKRFKTGYKELISLSIVDRLSGMVAILFLILAWGIQLFSAQFHFSLFLLAIGFGYIGYYFFIKWFFPLYAKKVHVTNFHSLNGQLLQTFAVYLLLLIIGVEKDFPAYIFVFLISSIVSAIPFTIGGIGARELTFLWGANYFHLDINQSLVISILFYLISLLSSLPGVYYSFRESAILQEQKAE